MSAEVMPGPGIVGDRLHDVLAPDSGTAAERLAGLLRRTAQGCEHRSRDLVDLL